MKIIVRLGRYGVKVLDWYAVKINDSVSGKGMRDCRDMGTDPSMWVVKVGETQRQPNNQQARQNRQYPGDHVAKQLARYSGFDRTRFRADRDLCHRNPAFQAPTQLTQSDIKRRRLTRLTVCSSSRCGRHLSDR